MMHLPPFDALIAFDAAARQGSMTRAATELGLTQSAVSHRLRRLETFMGTPLLLRQAGGVMPTAAGQALLDGLAGVLRDAADLKARCLAAAPPRRLRLGVGAALADHWLVRRLPEFTAARPDAAIELVVVENETPERVADLDLRILWVRQDEARATSTQRPLFREQVFPVCHPRLLPRGYRTNDPALLCRLPLLHKTSAGYAGDEWSWAAWFERLGLPGRPGEALRVASIGPAIAAALAGAGVVLARTMLVEDALADGRLTRLLPADQDQPCGKVHLVRWRARLQGDDRVDSFVSWLTRKAAERRTARVTEHATSAA